MLEFLRLSGFSENTQAACIPGGQGYLLGKPINHRHSVRRPFAEAVDGRRASPKIVWAAIGCPGGYAVGPRGGRAGPFAEDGELPAIARQTWFEPNVSRAAAA